MRVTFIEQVGSREFSCDLDVLPSRGDLVSINIDEAWQGTVTTKMFLIGELRPVCHIHLHTKQPAE